MRLGLLRLAASMALGGLRRPAGPGSVDEALHRMLSIRAQRVERARHAIPGNVAQQAFSLAVRNAGSAAQGLLERASLRWRVQGDAPGARAEFAAGAAFIDLTCDTIDQASALGLRVPHGVLGPGDASRRVVATPGPDCFVHVADLSLLLCLALLAGDMGRVARLVRAAGQPVVIDGTSRFDVHAARLLIACAAGDATSLAACQARWDEALGRASRAERRFHGEYGQYGPLMAAVLACDRCAIDAELDGLAVRFQARASDPRLGEGSVLDGFGPEGQARAFDFWATALARLACHHGLVLEHDSVPVPLRGLF